MSADKSTRSKCISRILFVGVIGGLSALGGAMLGLFGLDLFATGFRQTEDAVSYVGSVQPAGPPHETSPPPDTLKIMNWNIKFGGGRIDFWFDCRGDRVLMQREEVLENLERLVEKIDQVDPDILFIQEVDVNARRSAHIDMVQWLLDHTRLQYGVYASQWKARHIPRHGLGRMDSGNAILSRWPLEEGTRVALPLRTDLDVLTRYFYLKRNILEARLVLQGGHPLVLLNTHTEAFSDDQVKLRQIEILKDRMDRLDRQGVLFVAGGDLNTIPPHSERIWDYPDAACAAESYRGDDYRGEQGVLEPLYRDYQAAIPLEDYRHDNRPYFSHTTDRSGFWNRKLDYLFTNGKFVPSSGLTHQDRLSGGMETMPLSDHAPLTVQLYVPDRKQK